jgi:hypothetical protein
MAMRNQSRIGGPAAPASARMPPSPRQPSVKAVNAVFSVRPTASRFRRINPRCPYGSGDGTEYLATTRRRFDRLLRLPLEKTQISRGSRRLCCIRAGEREPHAASIICRQPSKARRAIPARQSRAASCYTTASSAAALGHLGAVQQLRRKSLLFEQLAHQSQGRLGAVGSAITLASPRTLSNMVLSMLSGGA